MVQALRRRADGDVVREMLAFAVERIMEAEIEARTGAAKGARTPMREAQRMDLHRFRSGQVFMLGGPLFEGHGGFPAEG
jgi:transposase-like protein